jgi:hypothetical protein
MERWNHSVKSVTPTLHCSNYQGAFGHEKEIHRAKRAGQFVKLGPREPDGILGQRERAFT